MTAVNPLSRSRAAGAHEPVHAAAQMGRLMRHLSSTFAREDWNGLRQSHFRLMSSIPVAGITITDLADRLGMTKQASGQFVTTLAADGYLDVRADPDDRRARLVFLTTQGVRTLRAVNARIARIEREWARVVGADRYAEFREVLAELVDHVQE